MPGSLTSCFLLSRRVGKRSRHSRRMRNPQLYVSGKRPMPFLVSIPDLFCMQQVKFKNSNIYFIRITEKFCEIFRCNVPVMPGGEDCESVNILCQCMLLQIEMNLPFTPSVLGLPACRQSACKHWRS